MSERDANDDDVNRDRYRDNDDVREPLSSDDRSGVRPDSRNEARGDARENVGRNARGTDASPSGPSGNDRTANRPEHPDQYDEDLARDNRRGREGDGMSDLAQDVRSGAMGFTPADGREDHNGWRSHARKGQAESPVELTHNEPPHHKEGHK